MKKGFCYEEETDRFVYKQEEYLAFQKLIYKKSAQNYYRLYSRSKKQCKNCPDFLSCATDLGTIRINASAYYPSFYRNSKKVGTSNYLRVMRLRNIYGFEASEGFISDVTDKIMPQIEDWQNWDAVSPIFKFSAEVRKVIDTTNAIESLNATYRKLNRQRSVFPSDTALLKALYLSTFEATKKWTMPIRNWVRFMGN